MTMTSRHGLAVAFTASLLTGLVAAAANAQSAGGEFDAEAYFSGKTIEVVINANAGGGLDTATRFLLHGFEEFIPGKPRIAPTNIAEIPGISAVHDAPATDARITIGVTSRVATLYATTLDDAATHDPHNIRILGGYGGNPQWTVIFNDAAEAYDSITDAAGSDSGPELVTSGMVGDASSLIAHPLFASWLCDTFDLRCRMVPVADANMVTWAQDIERGQINFVDSTSNALVRLVADDLISGKAKVLVEYTEEGSSVLQTPYERPHIHELLPDDEAREELDALMPLVASGGIGNAVFAGPEVPAEALEVLAAAFVEKARTAENLEQYTRGRFGEYPDHHFNPSVIGAEDGQQIYEAGMHRFFDSQDFYEELQKELYAKYWQ